MRPAAGNDRRACAEQYTYVSDQFQFGVQEDWRDHSAKILSGKPWQDDCDGFAMTVLMMMALEGFPDDKCGLAVVTVRDQGHAIVWYEAPTGEMFYADCNRDGVCKDEDARWNWVQFMRLNKPKQWFKYKDES